jgi:lysozyme
MTSQSVNFLDLFTSYKGLPWQVEALTQLGESIPQSLLHKDNKWYKTWENSAQGGNVEWFPLAEKIVREYEDCRLVAYQCKGGVWTVGWGSTRIDGRPVKQGDTVSQSKADEMNRKDLLESSGYLFRLIPSSKEWKPNQIAALVSFVHNVGPGSSSTNPPVPGLETSDLRKRVLAGENLDKVICEELPRWNKANGVEEIGLTRRRKSEVELFIGRQLQQPEKPPLTNPERTQWITKIRALNLSQPDASTCQAACIGMAVGDSNILGIRRKLLAKGDAGNPAVMAAIIREFGRPYRYEGDASLSEVYEWLKNGEFLITHGWFTGSGHVICLDGLKKVSEGEYSLDVKDPWSEFNAPAWRYDKSTKFYDGFYSDACIYAACVAGTSVSNARSVYQSGKVDPNRGGMWVHRFTTLPS